MSDTEPRSFAEIAEAGVAWVHGDGDNECVTDRNGRCIRWSHVHTPAPAVGRVEDEGLRARAVGVLNDLHRAQGYTQPTFGQIVDALMHTGLLSDRAEPQHDAPCDEWCNHCTVCGTGILHGSRCHDHQRRPAAAHLGDKEAVRAALADAWHRGYSAGHSNAMRRMSDEPNAPTSPNPYRSAALSAPGGRDNVRPTTGAGEVGEHPGFCRWKGCGPPVHNWPAHQAMHAQEAREAVRRHE